MCRKYWWRRESLVELKAERWAVCVWDWDTDSLSSAPEKSRDSLQQLCKCSRESDRRTLFNLIHVCLLLLRASSFCICMPPPDKMKTLFITGYIRTKMNGFNETSNWWKNAKIKTAGDWETHACGPRRTGGLPPFQNNSLASFMLMVVYNLSYYKQ